MLLLLLTGSEKKKVNIQLTFKAPEGENPSLNNAFTTTDGTTRFVLTKLN